MAKEDCRAAWGVLLLETMCQDLRFGVRTLAKSPGFTAAVVLVLAVGIGVNTAVFSIVDSVLLRPLPYKDSERLVWFWETDPRQGTAEMRVSPPTFLDWQTSQHSFEELSAFSEGSFTLTGAGEPESIKYAGVTASFFPLFGMTPSAGRVFMREDDRAGGERVVILSHQLWRTRFSSDPNVIGKALTLDGGSYTVVGVAPAGFNYPADTQAWTPLAPQIADALTIRGAHYLAVLGRLKRGVTLAQAGEEMNSITRRIAEADASYAGYGVRLVPLQQRLVGEVRPALLILLAAVVLVLLIACANVANLLLARAAARRREIAIRQALGASRRRVVRQLLTESLILALAGGAFGLLLAHWGLDLALAFSPQELPRADEIAVNSQALLFALASAVVTVFLFGLTPALVASKPGSVPSLKEGGTVAGGDVRGTRLRDVLVVSELALTLTLLVGAGLMLKSFNWLMRVDPGFNPQGVISFRISLLSSRYPEKYQQAAFFGQLLERVRALPGVSSAGLGKNLPVSGQNMSSPLLVEGLPKPSADKSPPVQSVTVDPGYVTTLGMRLTKGRDFTAEDGANATPVAIVNEALARRFFPGEDPLGKSVRTLFGQPTYREIVGVVADVRHARPGAAAPPQIFVPFAQSPSPSMTLVVKDGGDPTPVITAVRGAVSAIDKDQAIDKISTMEGLLSESVAQPRFYAFLLTSFAVIALLMAAAGLHGVISYAVARRTHEIGVRRALGAQPWDVYKLFLGQAVRLGLIGTGAGVLAALALTRLLTRLLFGVAATDPATFAVVPLGLIVVAVAACYLPARRATKVDPLVALRYE